MSKSTEHCAGCRNNYYNGQGAKECWSLKTAKVVTRYRLGWWTPPVRASAFAKVKTYDCHSAPGQYAHYTPEAYAAQAKHFDAEPVR